MRFSRISLVSGGEWIVKLSAAGFSSVSYIKLSLSTCPNPQQSPVKLHDKAEHFHCYYYTLMLIIGLLAGHRDTAGDDDTTNPMMQAH